MLRRALHKLVERLAHLEAASRCAHIYMQVICMYMGVRSILQGHLWWLDLATYSKGTRCTLSFLAGVLLKYVGPALPDLLYNLWTAAGA